ncbi:hypothetical protein OF83DRAFT_451358 [Amylostereum chailletii]|nr:hypothetical protein OF83DRAFT_451358 [Amylostereum chailletii]
MVQKAWQVVTAGGTKSLHYSSRTLNNLSSLCLRWQPEYTMNPLTVTGWWEAGDGVSCQYVNGGQEEEQRVPAVHRLAGGRISHGFSACS